jgi:hypothetical protein
VLSLEAASYETPQRVEYVARSLLGMTPPPPERVIALHGFAPRAADTEPRASASGQDDVSASVSDAGVATTADGGAP